MTRTSNVPPATFEYFARQSFTSDVPTTTPVSDSSLDASGSNAVTVHGRSSASEVSTDNLKESRRLESGASFEVPVLPSKPPQLAPSEHTFAPAHCGDYEYHGIPMISNPIDSTMTAVEEQRPTSSPPLANPLREQDTTGQTAPPGRTPRITALLWEDEGCMCFQVEAKNKAVQRRDDNHMINGTRLLMVAGVDRVCRDMMLKSEKMRHDVEFAPEHSKGVWIPYDRALDLANQYGITDSLYPLFVHNIGALLYHPENQLFSGIRRRCT